MKNYHHHYYKNITLRQAYLGGHFKIQLDNGQKLRVKLKPGAFPGKILRLKSINFKNQDPSDETYITLNVLAHPFYQISGLNLKAIIFVTPAEAKLGVTKRIKGPDGAAFNLTIIPGSQNGQEIIAKNAGLSDNKNNGSIFYQIKVMDFNDLSSRLPVLPKYDTIDQFN